MGRYKAYTKEFDEIVAAADMNVWNRDLLKTALDHQLKINRELIQHMHVRIHGLIAQGLLDPKKTAVTLLLDNSGSLREEHAYFCVSLAVITAIALEDNGIKTEILGYTTTDFKETAGHRRWLAHGKPPNPGRLNTLRHIIYKTPKQAWQKAKDSLCIALSVVLRKQNIDGEGIQWAASRLLKRRAPDKRLLVFSDESPVDGPTLENNPRDYLEKHFCAVISRINRRNKIALSSVYITETPRHRYSAFAIPRAPYQRRATIYFDKEATVVEPRKNPVIVHPTALDKIADVIAAGRNPFPAPQAG